LPGFAAFVVPPLGACIHNENCWQMRFSDRIDQIDLMEDVLFFVGYGEVRAEAGIQPRFPS